MVRQITAGRGMVGGDAAGLGVARLVAVLGMWIERHRQRRALAALDDAMLKDIGIGRGDVVRETGKPFWQA